jgi:exodeoxyribonuclease V alpha subunit
MNDQKQPHYTLTEEQEQAVQLTFGDQSLAVLTGGPGTGKSYVTRAIVSAHESLKRKVLLAAPTGKAARRLTEATGREAKTIHRLLEYLPDDTLLEAEPGDLPTTLSSFRRSSLKPLEADLVIVDEASMIDLRLMRALLRACNRQRTKLLLVGDADQLPPVGAGAPFQDIVGSGATKVVRLTQIHRQAEGSLIVQGAHSVLRGDTSFLEKTGADFRFIEEPRTESASDTVVDLVTRILPSEKGYHPLRDIQVLTPQSKGLLGTEALNLRLQAVLNPGTGGASATYGEIRQKDRVIQTRNDYTRGVMNGEWGQAESLDAEVLRVDMGDRVVSYPRNDAFDLSLAYALTVHRAQGSEYKAVVVVVHSSHAYMLSRTLLYTAMTRGRELVVLVGDTKGAKRAVANTASNKRRTLLQKLLQNPNP